MNIEFSPLADKDLENIRIFIAQDNPQVANTVVTRILQSIDILENFPLLGREGRKPGTREFSVSGLPYFVVYKIPDAYRVTIVRIFHTSRQYP